MEDLRGFIKRLEVKQEILRIQKKVDARYISGLVSKSDKALYFENVDGFDFPVVSGLFNTRNRVALAMKVAHTEIGSKMQEGIDHPIKPEIVKNGPVQEVVYAGKDVDLSIFPIPLLSEKDGGPYISGGVISPFDPAYGYNAGMYRLMYRKKMRHYTRLGFGDEGTSESRCYYCSRSTRQTY